MAYQQPPYQSTVINPVVVVQPEQPVLKSGGYDAGNCIICIGVLGGMCIIGSVLLLSVVGIELASMDELRGAFKTVLMIGIILGSFGVLLIFISCCVCITGYNKYKKKCRSQENSAPRYEPYTDAEISPGYVYSGQGQPAVGQPVVGTGSPGYVPMASFEEL